MYLKWFEKGRFDHFFFGISHIYKHLDYYIYIRWQFSYKIALVEWSRLKNIFKAFVLIKSSQKLEEKKTARSLFLSKVQDMLWVTFWNICTMIARRINAFFAGKWLWQLANWCLHTELRGHCSASSWFLNTKCARVRFNGALDLFKACVCLDQMLNLIF